MPEGLICKRAGGKCLYILRNASKPQNIRAFSKHNTSLRISLHLCIYVYSYNLYIYICITQAFHKDDVHMNRRLPNLVGTSKTNVLARCALLCCQDLAAPTTSHVANLARRARAEKRTLGEKNPTPQEMQAPACAPGIYFCCVQKKGPGQIPIIYTYYMYACVCIHMRSHVHTI